MRFFIVSLMVALTIAAPASAASPPPKIKVAIYKAFGPRYGPQAIRVASCETGGTFDLNAHNGQYLGLFQMGSNERRLYGHGSTAYAQAKAANRYFIASGRDWSPWSCKPWY